MVGGDSVVAARRGGGAGASGCQLGGAGVSVPFGEAEGRGYPEIVRTLHRIRVLGGAVSPPGEAGRGRAGGRAVCWCALGGARGGGKRGLAEVRGPVGVADGG